MSQPPTSSAMNEVAPKSKYSDLVFDMIKMQIVSIKSHDMEFNEIKDLKINDDSNGQVVVMVLTDVTPTLVTIDKDNEIKLTTRCLILNHMRLWIRRSMYLTMPIILWIKKL